MKDKKEKSSIDYKESAIAAGSAVGGALVGGYAGAAVGKPSLAIGLLTMAAGGYVITHKNTNLGIALLSAGAGMAVADGTPDAGVPEAAAVQGLSGLHGEAVNAMQRGNKFLSRIMAKAYIPQTVIADMGLGNVQAPVKVFTTEKAPVSDAEMMKIMEEMKKSAMPQVAESMNGGLLEDYGMGASMLETYAMNGDLLQELGM